jgi:hypothetical protein
LINVWEEFPQGFGQTKKKKRFRRIRKDEEKKRFPRIRKDEEKEEVPKDSERRGKEAEESFFIFLPPLFAFNEETEITRGDCDADGAACDLLL